MSNDIFVIVQILLKQLDNQIIGHATSSRMQNTHWCKLQCIGGVDKYDITDVAANTGAVGLLPDTQNCGLRMRRECREHFLRHRLQRKPLFSDPGMHHGT